MAWYWYGDTFDEVNNKHKCSDCDYYKECESASDNDICGDFVLIEGKEANNE